MSHRNHLFSLRTGYALGEVLAEGCDRRQQRNITIRFSSWQFQPLKTLAKARGHGASPLDWSFSSLDEAVHDVCRGGAQREVG